MSRFASRGCWRIRQTRVGVHKRGCRGVGRHGGGSRAGERFGLLVERVPGVRRFRGEAPVLREAKLLFELSNPFAQLPVACLEFTDIGLGGWRQSGEVVLVHASTIAKCCARWVYGNL